ncbi:MAG: hypothetical protein KAR20_02445, partial [Candidatus Heimdallarchaeota archaeon]|nr:hypothetical protein [Candidatus Heimdallarchaeota archaeon]
YPYQVYDLNVVLKENRITERNLPDIIQSFHDTHFRYYASNDSRSHIEAVAWRVSAIGKTSDINMKETLLSKEKESIAFKSKRKVFFRNENDFIETSIYDGDKLGFGHIINGPAIVEEKSTTIVIPPDFTLYVTKYRNYYLKHLI